MTKTEIFIIKAKETHGDLYDYSLVDYINNYTNIKIICPVHGIFEQSPKNHISKKYKCSKCSKRCKKSKSEFIIESNKIHDNFYDYSLSEYIDANTKVKIICPIHGIFEQSPASHINKKQGCSECKNNKKLTNEIFIERSNKIHNNFYDYSLSEYKNNKTKVKIICPIHGVFEQCPTSHSISGCPSCAKKAKRLKRIEEITINKFNGNQYMPSFNIEACEIFDEIMLKEGIFIQHAMNGGEYYIKELCYWVDGYDKENNVVYEFDERQHFKKGKLKDKDLKRQKEIENFLKCTFIRIKKSYKN